MILVKNILHTLPVDHIMHFDITSFKNRKFNSIWLFTNEAENLVADNYFIGDDHNCNMKIGWTNIDKDKTCSKRRGCIINILWHIQLENKKKKMPFFERLKFLFKG